MTIPFTRIALTCVVALTSACASSQTDGAPSAHGHHLRDTNDTRLPEARYRAAVQQKFAGDAQGYYDALLQLAVDAPESRAGRRARATLRSVDLLSGLMMVNGIGSVFVPYRHGLMTGLDESADDGLLEHLLRDVEKPRKKDQQLADEGKN